MSMAHKDPFPPHLLFLAEWAVERKIFLPPRSPSAPRQSAKKRGIFPGGLDAGEKALAPPERRVKKSVFHHPVRDEAKCSLCGPPRREALPLASFAS